METPKVPLLKDLAFFFVVNQVPAYSPAALALLPPRVRRDLLDHLPAVELWRLESCAEFTGGLDMEEVWKARVETHIKAWVSPEELSPPGDESASSRELYLAHLAKLLLFTTSQDLQQHTSLYHAPILPGTPSVSSEEDSLALRKKFNFRLGRAAMSPSSIAVLVKKEKYIAFLFYGIFMNIPSRVLPRVFDPQRKYYYIPISYARGPHSIVKRNLGKTFGEWVGYLVERVPWGPKKLDFGIPSPDFVSSSLDRRVLSFLRFLEEICVTITSDLTVHAVTDVLRKLFGSESELPVTSLSIEVQYFHQLSWILPEVAKVCGKAEVSQSGYSRLKSIKIRVFMEEFASSKTAQVCKWSKMLFQEEIKSVVLVRLKTCVPSDLCRTLSHLLATRASLALIELVNCSINVTEMQLLVSTFLRTPTSHTQTLSIREWHLLREAESSAVTRTEATPSLTAALKETLNLPCQSSENKVLCLPFIPSGPCSLPWLLSLPQVSLSSLELTVPSSPTHATQLLEILSTSESLPVTGITVTFESKNPSATEKAHADIIFDLAMCPHVGEVQITKLS